MVVVGGWNVPAIEWCSIRQACRWIELRELPVSRGHEGLFGRPDGDMPKEAYDGAWQKIAAQAGLGAVSLRGLRATEIRECKHTSDGLWFDIAERTDRLEAIPSESISRANITPEGVLYWHDGGLPDNWAVYFPVKVNFSELERKYPRPAEMDFRIGGDAFAASEAPVRRLTFDVDAWITLAQAIDMLRQQGDTEEQARARLEYRLCQRRINIGYLVRVSPEDEDGWSLDTIHINKDDLPWPLVRFDWKSGRIDFQGHEYLPFNPFNREAEIRLLRARPEGS